MKQRDFSGRGGSYTVGDEVKKNRGGTLNPEDPGYRAAFHKAPVQDAQQKGTLNRSPTFRDLEQKPAAPKPAAPTNQAQGGKR